MMPLAMALALVGLPKVIEVLGSCRAAARKELHLRDRLANAKFKEGRDDVCSIGGRSSFAELPGCDPRKSFDVAVEIDPSGRGTEAC